jgi:endonuclease YncB( thermonuclease family)
MAREPRRAGLFRWLAATVLFSACAWSAWGAERPVVIDGETLQIEGQVVDLVGIDAPELGQLCERNGDLWPCGEHAAWTLHKLLAVDDFQCSPWQEAGKTPAEGRKSVLCRQGDRDLGEVLIEDGYALATSPGFPSYAAAENDARSAGLGLWRGPFDRPSAWRSQHEPARAMTPCPIQAARNEAGGSIYYVPTDADYKAFQDGQKLADQRFCSDDEASRQGWIHLGEK